MKVVKRIGIIVLMSAMYFLVSNSMGVCSTRAVSVGVTDVSPMSPSLFTSPSRLRISGIPGEEIIEVGKILLQE